MLERTFSKANFRIEGSILFFIITLCLIFPFNVLVRASTGNVLIMTNTPPSPQIIIKIGEGVNLYFGEVIWSGGAINLYLSRDGYASLTVPGDVPYGPLFSVAKLRDNVIDTTTYPGYIVGFNWINGTVPISIEIPGGGSYYIKAFDGSTSSIAVTDNYITIQATFEVTPSSGPGGALIQLKGYALPANDYANLSYNVDGGAWRSIQDLFPSDAKGRFVYNMSAPDTFGNRVSSLTDEWLSNNNIEFKMIVNSTAQTDNNTFIEYWKGLKQVSSIINALAPEGQLFGNGTDFGALGVSGIVSGSIIIAGKWFYPGTVTIFWDKATNLGTTTANATGFFNITVTVPITFKGSHNITVVDTKAFFVVWINIIPTLTLDPVSGPVGIFVTALGYGFPASINRIYNVTLWWDSKENLTRVTTDLNGYFTAQFTVPNTNAGTHFVVATADDYALTSATSLFPIIYAPTGTLAIDTTPINGEIFVNGKSWGIAPQTRIVQVGSYTISFSQVIGYNTPSNQTVTVYISQTTAVTGIYKVQKTRFSPKINGYAFPNSISKQKISYCDAYRALSSTTWSSLIPKQDWPLFAAFSIIVHQFQLGNCFGMSYTAEYYFEHSSAFMSKYPTYINMYAVDVATASPEILVNQFPGQEANPPYLYNLALTYFGLKSINAEIQWIMTECDNYHVVQLYLVKPEKDPFFSHSVLIYNYELAGNELTLDVYDPNHNGTTSYITLLKDQYGNFALTRTGRYGDLVIEYDITRIGAGESTSINWSLLNERVNDFTSLICGNVWSFGRSSLGIKVTSPVNILVADLNDSRVGFDSIAQSEVNEIDGAFYSGKGTEPQVVIMPEPANDTFKITLVGTAIRNYTLTTEYAKTMSNDRIQNITFTAINIPITDHGIHQYTINFTILSQDKEGISLKVDSNGDSTVERSIICGKELTRDDFMHVTYSIDSYSGLEIEVDNILYIAPQLFKWPIGSSHKVFITSPQSGGNGVRYIWTGWSDGGEQTHLVTVGDKDTRIIADFKIQYYLTVKSEHGNPKGEGWYDAAATATFSITSPTGIIIQQTFTGWSGDTTSAITSASVIMNGPRTVIASWRTDYTQLIIIIAIIAIFSLIIIITLKKSPST